MYNHVELLGRVGNDAECENKKRPVSFSLATWENYRDENEESGWKTETTWHNIIVWGNPDIKKHYMSKIKKGLWVLVDGKIVQNKWEDDDGNKRVTVRIHANSVKVLPAVEASSGGGASNTAAKPSKKKKDEDAWESDAGEKEEDDLPF